jgi:hypothetical protein
MTLDQFNEILEEEGVTGSMEIDFIDIGSRDLQDNKIFVNVGEETFSVQE